MDLMMNEVQVNLLKMFELEPEKITLKSLRNLDRTDLVTFILDISRIANIKKRENFEEREMFALRELKLENEKLREQLNMTIKGSRKLTKEEKLREDIKYLRKKIRRFSDDYAKLEKEKEQYKELAYSL